MLCAFRRRRRNHCSAAQPAAFIIPILLVLVTSDARAFSPCRAFLPLALALSLVQRLGAPTRAVGVQTASQCCTACQQGLLLRSSQLGTAVLCSSGDLRTTTCAETRCRQRASVACLARALVARVFGRTMYFIICAVGTPHSCGELLSVVTARRHLMIQAGASIILKSWL